MQLIVIGRGVSGQDLEKQGIVYHPRKRREKRPPTLPVEDVEVVVAPIVKLVKKPKLTHEELEARRKKDRDRYYTRIANLGPEAARAMWRKKGKAEREGFRGDKIRKAKRDSYHRRKEATA